MRRACNIKDASKMHEKSVRGACDMHRKFIENAWDIHANAKRMRNACGVDENTQEVHA